MGVSLVSVELLAGKIEMGEDKNQNFIGPLAAQLSCQPPPKQPPEACGSLAG